MHQYKSPSGAWNALRIALGFIIINGLMELKFWQVLPDGHPTRIYMTGRAKTTGTAVSGTLMPTRASKWLVVGLAALVLVALFLLMDALSHALQLNPFEGLFVHGEPSLQPVGNIPLTRR